MVTRVTACTAARARTPTASSGKARGQSVSRGTETHGSAQPHRALHAVTGRHSAEKL